MIDSSIVTLVGLGLTGIILLFLFLSPVRRSKEESGLTPFYEERCTGRKKIGFGFSIGGNMPTWRIAFYEDFFIIASIGSTKILYAEVESLEFRRQIISKGLSIKIRGSRTEIILFPNKTQKIIDIFKKKGVPVTEEN